MAMQAAQVAFFPAASPGADPAALIDHLRQGRPHLFEADLARALGLRITEVRRMVHDRVGARLAVACRAAGFSRGQFQEAFRMIQSSIAPMPSPGFCGADWPSQVAALFDTIPEAEAGQTLKRWRRATTTASLPLPNPAVY